MIHAKHYETVSINLSTFFHCTYVMRMMVIND